MRDYFLRMHTRDCVLRYSECRWRIEIDYKIMKKDLIRKRIPWIVLSDGSSAILDDLCDRQLEASEKLRETAVVV